MKNGKVTVLRLMAEEEKEEEEEEEQEEEEEEEEEEKEEEICQHCCRFLMYMLQETHNPNLKQIT